MRYHNVETETNPLADIPSELMPLIPGFLQRRNQEAVDILTHLQRGEYVAIAEIAHKMKGNGGGFGLGYISELGARLEAAAKEKNEHRVQSLTRNLTEYVRYVTSQLQRGNS